MFNKELGCYISVISASRPYNVKKMELSCGPCTWYVPKGQKDLYYQMGACEVVESGRLCASRNKALEDAFAQDAACVQLSDDLRSMCTVLGERDQRKVDFDFVLMGMKLAARANKVKLVGVAPTANLFFYRLPSVKMNKFIVGDCMWVEPNELRFDESMSLKEDYDYTLQHIKQYGGVARCDDLLLAFAHRTNRGGACEYRTKEREKENIKYLKEKWGDVIGASRRGDTEITLKI